jgi:hypothetical protein
VIFMRTISIVRPPACICSGFAVARPAMRDQQLDAKSVRQHHRLYHPSGSPASRRSARPRSLRSRWHRPIDLPGSV